MRCLSCVSFGCFSGLLVFVVFCFCVAVGFSEVLTTLADELESSAGPSL